MSDGCSDRVACTLDAPDAAAAGPEHRDLDIAARHAAQAEQRRGGPMAQDAAVACEHRRHAEAVGGQEHVPDRVDASVDAMQPADLDAIPDLRPC